MDDPVQQISTCSQLCGPELGRQAPELGREGLSPDINVGRRLARSGARFTAQLNNWGNNMYRSICLFLLGLLATAPSMAQQSPVGTYKLASLEREIDGKVAPSTGAPSHGYLIITPKVYVSLLTDGTRKYGDSAADKAALWESLTTHGGTYRVVGAKLVMKPDTHSNESFVGREDVRDWQVKGNRLLLTTQPRPFSRDPSKIVISRQEWERLE